ncbi:MAG: ergothioneine biosynthesis protein EgtB [Cyclobacteriaceae bacterium]
MIQNDIAAQQLEKEYAESFSARFQTIRQQSVHLCKPLRTEDYVVQPVEDVSPPKWHLAHTTWFFEQFILKPHQPGYQLYDKQFNYVFNSYYESMGEKMLRNHRGNMTRPSTEDIYTYREYVDRHMLELIHSPEFKDQLMYLTELGLQHEQQHQELLVTDIKFILGNNPLFPAYLENSSKTVDGLQNLNKKRNFIEVKGGNYPIGFQGEGFHYDNEEGYHQVYLHDYRILDRLISNEEYLAFMEDGGYDNFDLWLAEGRDFVSQLSTKAPLYWHKMDGKWYHYTMNGLQEVDLAAPVTHVSYFEADAFARWCDKRLPTEQEWEVACHQAGYQDDLHILAEASFVDNQQYRPLPQRADATDKIPAQMMGDVWEWTLSAYLPYPFYKRVEGALGEYNGKFMSNQMVLRGGSCATPESHIRTTYRNFFQTDKRWQFTGIRLAEHI